MMVMYKYAILDTGEVCVDLAGMILMQVWLADNLGSYHDVYTDTKGHKNGSFVCVMWLVLLESMTHEMSYLISGYVAGSINAHTFFFISS